MLEQRNMLNLSQKEKIAMRVAQEIMDGDFVNLGIGLPTKVADFIPEGMYVTLQSENGIIGMGAKAKVGEGNPNLVNAGNEYTTIVPGASFCDHAVSFGFIRGGHIDLTVLGSLEVDETGSLANHIIPGKMVPGMGGAMDLLVGAKKVIVATVHTKKNGKSAIVKRISLPATGVSCVDMIITDLAVFEVIEEGLLLKEIAVDYTVEQIQELTEPQFLVSPDLKVIFKEPVRFS